MKMSAIAMVHFCAFCLAGSVLAADSANWGPTGQFDVGTRITSFMLTDSKEDSFIGTINHLDEQQNYLPIKVFGTWWFSPSFGVGLTWDGVEARADTSQAHSDGSFKASGPIALFTARYVNKSRWTPYAETGPAWWFTCFDAEQWWELGYSSKQDWIDLGSSDEARNSTRRHMDMDDAFGWVVDAGSGIRLAKHVSLDLMLRYMYIESDTHYYVTRKDHIVDDRGTTSLPLSHFAGGLGVKVDF